MTQINFVSVCGLVGKGSGAYILPTVTLITNSKPVVLRDAEIAGSFAKEITDRLPLPLGVASQ